MNTKTFNIAVLLLLIPVYSSLAQNTITIQPDPQEGKDAAIRALYIDSASSHATYEYIRSSAWTHSGIYYIWKTLIDFPVINELEGVNSVSNAKLVLYADREFENDYGGQYNDNTTLLSLVTEPWEEDVVWHNRPSYDPSYQVTIPRNNDYDSIEVDITSLVNQRLQNGLPFHGLIFEPSNPNTYRSMVFWTSDAPDPSKRPKLVLEFSREGSCPDCVSDYWSFTPLSYGPSGGIFRSGSVAIGIDDPGEYKLAVGGQIAAQEIVVDVDTWPDFVFDPNYQMISVDSLETFILENHHLPGVPSEEEVYSNGVSVGEMNAAILQQLEELTLRVISLTKENRELMQRIEMLEK